MNFKLYYKEYDFKFTWEAKVQFHRETGLDLWSVFQSVVLLTLRNEGSDLDLMKDIGQEIGEIPAVHALYCIAKAKNPHLKINEIADGVSNVGWRTPTDGNDWNQPYPRIMHKISLDLDDQYEKEAIKAKKLHDPSQDM